MEEVGVAGSRGKPCGEEGGMWVGGRGNADIIADAMLVVVVVVKERVAGAVLQSIDVGYSIFDILTAESKVRKLIS